jgi:hypothetical protein
MSKYPEIDPQLLDELIAVVQHCWDCGSPVAGSSRVRWEQIALVAIRRMRSFSRRGIARDDIPAQIRDIAEAFVSTLEPRPELVGPLITDYQYVAERCLDAANRIKESN